MEDNQDTFNINDAFDKYKKSMQSGLGMMDSVLSKLIPQSTVKRITIEVVEKKGFLGFGRKVKKINASAYISMNNIICLDISDKDEMQKYFDELK